MLDWNCATRALPLAAIDWYPWRKFSSYQLAINDEPAAWPLSTAGACTQGIGADAVALSAASGTPFVAPGSLVSIYGSNLGSSASIQVRDAAGGSQSASLSFVGSNQVNFLMPADVAPGQAGLSLTTNGGPTRQGTALISKVAPAIFTADGTGAGVALAATLRISDNQSSVNPIFQCGGGSCTAIPIDLSGSGQLYLIVYATGIRNHSGPVSAFINGVSVTVAYAGPQGQVDGLDQINIGPLTNLSALSDAPLVLLVDTRQSNIARVTFR
jgi:uncharacterized protein (TIGR03437 family)